MKIIKIPGVPIAQARMKFTSRGKFGRAYDPCAKVKKQLREYLEHFRVEEGVFKFPRISFLFEMPIPKSIPKRTLEKYTSKQHRHDKKPDVDNLIKLYLDCLDGIVIFGDQAVSLGECAKVYSSHPCTTIFIEETSQEAKFALTVPWTLSA
jgi:Holliday junction resolvase RusA-like endonuclease